MLHRPLRRFIKSQKMRAAVLKGYGQPLEVVDDAPEPNSQPLAPHEVLIKVHAAGVNPAEYKIARGDMSRFMSTKFPAVLGADFSGTVAQVGNSIPDFVPGDEVFGTLDVSEIVRPGNGGSYAEYESRLFVYNYINLLKRNDQIAGLSSWMSERAALPRNHQP